MSWLSCLRGRGLIFQASVLTAIVLVALGLTAGVATELGGRTGLVAASLAALFCLAGALTALAIGRVLRGPQHAMAALWTSMAARMGIPLVLGLPIHLQGGPLADAGLLYYVLIFYPLTLAASTALSLPDNRRPTPVNDASAGVTL